jgi:hypothetical protein
LRINHVGNCIRTKSPFADWSSDNYKGQNKKSAPVVIMEDLELIKGGFTHLGMIRREERWIRERKDSSHLSSGTTLKHINKGNQHKVNIK